MRPRNLRLVIALAGFALAVALSSPADASDLCEPARNECARGGDCKAYMCYCFGEPFCGVLG